MLSARDGEEVCCDREKEYVRRDEEEEEVW